MTNPGTSEESGTDSGSMTPPPTKKVYCKQEFNEKWLDEPRFAKWLVKCEDSTYYVAKCLACNRMLQGGRNDMRKHSETQKHLKMLLNMEIGPFSEESELSNVEKIKRAEVIYVLDIIEYSRSFNSYQHFAEMTSRAGSDSKILKKIKLKRIKIAAIVKYVINRSVVEKVTGILKNIPFSILVDESTDISGDKNLYILARYMYESKIQTYMLEYLRLKSGTAEYLYTCFIYAMEKYKLPVSNIIGIGIDNANVMLGKHNSFVSRLLEANGKEVAVFPCVCHSLHLVACHACEKIPARVAKLLHMLYKHLCKSNVRQEELKEIQEVMNIAPQKLIEPAKTRWLALAHSIGRVVKQWNALFGYFSTEIEVDDELYGTDNGTAKIIFQNLNCLYTKAYMNFLNYALQFFNEFNKLFQTNRVLIQEFMSESDRFLRTIAFNFVHPEIVDKEDLYLIDPFDTNNLLPVQSMNIGHEAGNIIETLRGRQNAEEDTEIANFLKNCQQFYQDAFKGAVQRLPYGEAFMKQLSFLMPNNALSATKT